MENKRQEEGLWFRGGLESGSHESVAASLCIGVARSSIPSLGFSSLWWGWRFTYLTGLLQRLYELMHINGTAHFLAKLKLSKHYLTFFKFHLSH